MNAILGFAQLLELDELAGEQGDNVQQILRAGHHLLELITELLDIARIEAGELALSLEPVSIDDLLAEAVNLTRPHGEKLGVAVSTDGDTGGWVFADRQRALQVLLNLLVNGVKYNRPGGSVTIGCSRERRSRRDRRARHRPRDRAGGPRAAVRAVRAARSRGRDDRRRRPRPRARAATRRGDGRHDLGHEHHRRREHVHGRAAASRRPARRPRRDSGRSRGRAGAHGHDPLHRGQPRESRSSSGAHSRDSLG